MFMHSAQFIQIYTQEPHEPLQKTQKQLSILANAKIHASYLGNANALLIVDTRLQLFLGRKIVFKDGGGCLHLCKECYSTNRKISKMGCEGSQFA